ncbi:MAG: Iron-sulfur cluster carrier protein [Myxococcota bacterium]|nr:Iron-sulfur cluster carrier protein [Myxococcota bacterium]
MPLFKKQETPPSGEPTPPAPASAAASPSGGLGQHPAGKKPVQREEGLIPQVRHVVLVGSGKGGVGKSTVSTNLAVALAQTGRRVGLLDADIHGPSIPILMGVAHKPNTEGRKIKPVESHGVKLMSIGFIAGPDDATIWRGPMIHGALMQFMRDVLWGELDYLVVDMPPGTSDAQLSMGQQVRPDGAIIVTTPQMVAVAEALRVKDMNDKLGVRTLGVVENMSFFECDQCHAQSDIFGSGGGGFVSREMKIPLLARLPVDETICSGGDAGAPIVILKPASAAAKEFAGLAQRVIAGVEAAPAEQ